MVSLNFHTYDVYPVINNINNLSMMKVKPNIYKNNRNNVQHAKSMNQMKFNHKSMNIPN